MAEKIVKPITNPIPPPAPTVQITVQGDSKPVVDEPQKTGESEQPEKLTADTDTILPSDPYYMDPMFYEVANYFDIKPEEYSAVKLKLSDIVDYVIQQKKSNKTEDILIGLRELEDIVQPPVWGERRYTNVHRYVRLAGKKNAIEQAMSAFKKGGFNG